MGNDPKDGFSNSDRLEIEVYEGKTRNDADRLWGNITERESGQTYEWSLSRLRRATPDCIKGTDLAALNVYEAGSGKSLVQFEDGQWKEPAQDQAAEAIRDRLIEDYSDRVNFMGERPDPAGPRVIDTMTHAAIGRAMLEAPDNAAWKRIQAELLAPVNNNPETIQAAAFKNAERDAASKNRMQFFKSGATMPETDKDGHKGKPDLTNLKILPVDEAALKEQRDNTERSEQNWQAKKQAMEAHPLRDVPRHVRDEATRILEGLAGDRNADGDTDGWTKEGARTILKSALTLLDTEYSPAFAPEQESAPVWTSEELSELRRIKREGNERAADLDKGR